MKINWVSRGGDHLATHRWRVKVPAYGIDGDGVDCRISAEGDPEADINVFQKHFNPKGDAEFVLQNKGNTKTHFDIADDHFDREAGPFYEFMCENCDSISCPTARMQERIYQVTGKLANIIPDPLSFPHHEFKYKKDPKFIWYGNRVNITSIYKWMQQVPNLTLVCNIDGSIDFPSHVTFIPWSVGIVEDIIDEHDIVLIPRNDYEWAKTKSPNRATDALHAGKYVITDFEEVYDSLDGYIYIGDLRDGLEFYRDNEDTVARMVELGQAYVEDHFNEDVVVDTWRKVLIDDYKNF